MNHDTNFDMANMSIQIIISRENELMGSTHLSWCGIGVLENYILQHTEHDIIIVV